MQILLLWISLIFIYGRLMRKYRNCAKVRIHLSAASTKIHTNRISGRPNDEG